MQLLVNYGELSCRRALVRYEFATAITIAAYEICESDSKIEGARVSRITSNHDSIGKLALPHLRYPDFGREFNFLGTLHFIQALQHNLTNENIVVGIEQVLYKRP